MKVIGKTFRKDGAKVKAFMENYSTEKIDEFVSKIENGEKINVEELGEVEITKDMYKISEGIRKIHGEFVVPRVCEPSFGIDRILSLLLDHSFYVRAESEQRNVFGFHPTIAPVHVVVCPLLCKGELISVANDVKHKLRHAGLRADIDKTGATIGRRYSRNDELGIPFGVTVDGETLDKSCPNYNTVTIRERDSMEQIRVPIEEVADVVAKLSKSLSWKDVAEKYGLWKSGAGEE